MLKTEQARTGTYTVRLDKPVNQKTVNSSVNKQKPQYLDVVLAKGSKDEKLNINKSKNVTVANVKNETGLKNVEKKSTKINALTGKPSGASTAVFNGPKFSLGGNKVNDKKSKQDADGDISPTQKNLTFREKQKIDNQKKQKLYESLDRMLDGEKTEKITLKDLKRLPEHKEVSHSQEPVIKLQKRGQIPVFTRESLYPAISQEARDKHGGNISHRDSTVPYKKEFGSHGEVLHIRELKAQQRLEKLDKIDDFSFNDSPRKPKQEQQTLQTTQSVSVGIPVNAGNTTGRRHIVADIPVYLPTFAGGNQPIVPETGPVPLGKVYERTLPEGATNKPAREGADKPSHAPEAFVGPVPGFDTADLDGNKSSLNPTYRVTGNPVSERLLKEQAKRERSLLEKENLNYFDLEPEAGATTARRIEPSVRASVESDKRGGVNETLLSDPGPTRSRLVDVDLDKQRASPDGYLAQKERKDRIERAERSLQKTEERKLLVNREPMTQRSIRNGNEVPKYDNQYQIDFYAQKSRSEIRNSKNIDREDSWIKLQLERPTRSPVAMDSYQGHGYSERNNGQNTYRLNHSDRHDSKHRSNDSGYNERYGSPLNRDRGNRRNGSPLDRDRDQRRNGSPLDRDRAYRRDRDADLRYNPRHVERDLRDLKYDRNGYRDERDRHDNSNDRRNFERKTQNPELNRNDRGDVGRSREYPHGDNRSFEERPRRVDDDRNFEGRPRRADERGTVPSDDRPLHRGVQERNDRDVRGYASEGRERRQFNDRDQGFYRQNRDLDDRRGPQRNDREPLNSQYNATQHEDRYKRDRYEQTPRDGYPRDGYPRDTNPNERMTGVRSNDKTDERSKYNSRTDSDKAMPTASKSTDGKVQYVLKVKNDNGKKPDVRQSQTSLRSEPLPENVPPSSTELTRTTSPKSSVYSKATDEMKTQPKDVQQRSNKPEQERKEKPVLVKQENNFSSARPPTYETNTLKKDQKGNDDLNKYFDEPERPDSPSNVIPFYSDNVSSYSKPKNNFRDGEFMTPVQESSVKVSEDDDGQFSKTDKGSEKGRISDKEERDNRVKFLSSNENKHEIKEDRRSPWRPKGDSFIDAKSPSLKEEPPVHLDDATNINKGPDSVVEMRERIREKTAEKISQIRKERKREKTIDSQGPTDNKDEINEALGEIDIDDLDLDNVETEIDEREMYVCYLLTDNGEKIGPLKLDINDVQIGLPNPDKLPDVPEQTGEVEDEGMRNRQTGSHGLNEFSSRSHSMLMLTIDSEMQDPDDENLYITKRGKLTFVDLAGSEKVKDSNSTADTLVESNSINKSLLVLGNCISSLGDQKRRQGHIPYRDSKLTKLLADSLGGNGVTLMICCVTPSSHHAPETMNTLRYASRAKKIRTKPVVKMDPREKLILSLKREIKVLRNENHYLRQQIGVPIKNKPKTKVLVQPSDEPKESKEPKENIKKISDIIKNPNSKEKNPNTNDASNKKVTKTSDVKLEFPAKPKGQIQKENDQKMAKFMKETNGKPETNNTVYNNDEKLKNGGGGSADESGLYEMLQEYMVENEALRTENAEMQVNRDKVRQDQQSLYRDNERLVRRVDDLERRLNQAQSSWQSMPRQGSHQSREHSPRGSPQYRAVGSGGKGQARFPPPPTDLPMRDNPALRDHMFPGSPPQGYNNSPSGTGNGRRQQPSPGRQQPSPSRNQPMKPPHRLADTIPQQRPVNEQNGPPYMNGHPGGHPVPGHPVPHPAMHPAQTGPYRQAHIGSPNRPNDLRMDSRRSSQSTSSDAIRDMNEKLKQELMQLDGEIHHHQVINHHRPNNPYGSQGSMR